MINEIHENLLGKYMPGGRAAAVGGGGGGGGGDGYSDFNDPDCFYNAVNDERPTRDLGFNNNRNPSYGATP